jgi:hypothetical protein
MITLICSQGYFCAIAPNLSDASFVDLYRFMTLELTEDKTEGHEAWRQRRDPVFKGR